MIKRILEGVVAGLLVAALTPVVLNAFLPNLLPAFLRGLQRVQPPSDPLAWVRVGLLFFSPEILGFAFVVLGMHLTDKRGYDEERTGRILGFWWFVSMFVVIFAYFVVSGWHG